jgi:hypothetical protein
MILCKKCAFDGYKTKAEFAIIVNKALHTYKDDNQVDRSFFVDVNPRTKAYLCQPCLKYTKETQVVQFDIEIL